MCPETFCWSTKLPRCYPAAPQNPVWILCFRISFPSLRPACFPSGNRPPLWPGKNLHERSCQIKPRGHACPRGLLPLPPRPPLSSLWDEVPQPSSWPPALEDKKSKMPSFYSFCWPIPIIIILFSALQFIFLSFLFLFLTFIICKSVKRTVQYANEKKKKKKF